MSGIKPARLDGMAWRKTHRQNSLLSKVTGGIVQSEKECNPELSGVIVFIGGGHSDLERNQRQVV